MERQYHAAERDYMITLQPRILCVDDDPDLLFIAVETLRLAGYEVMEASTGNECLAAVNKEHPDLVLLDVNLPDINGIDLCRRIKTEPEFEGIYVVLISGTLISSDMQAKGLEAGADGYIARPISGDEFLARIKALLRIKAVETELRESNERLRQKTIEIDEAKLLAESASRAKSEFLANMSHEFITPLNAVIGFSQVLKDGLSGDLNDKQKEYVDYILQGGLQLFTILNQIIELARVESDKEKIKSGRFLLKDALKSSVAAFDDRAVTRSLKIMLEIEPDAEIEIETDAGKLRRILYNLIDNAVKFTPDGGSVSVQARLTRDEGERRWARDEKR